MESQKATAMLEEISERAITLKVRAKIKIYHCRQAYHTVDVSSARSHLISLSRGIAECVPYLPMPCRPDTFVGGAVGKGGGTNLIFCIGRLGPGLLKLNKNSPDA